METPGVVDSKTLFRTGLGAAANSSFGVPAAGLESGPTDLLVVLGTRLGVLVEIGRFVESTGWLGVDTGVDETLELVEGAVDEASVPELV